MFLFLSTHARRARWWKRVCTYVAVRILQIVIYTVEDSALVNDQYCKLLENAWKFFNRLCDFLYFNATLFYFLNFKKY